MGNKAISEANGVSCSVCSVKMPKNDWQYTQFQNFYCFFSRKDEGQSIAYNLSQKSSKTVNIGKGTPVVKYFRTVGVDNQYKCVFCFSKTESMDTCRAMDQELIGKGIFSIPREKLTQTRGGQTHCTTLLSFHNTRLRGHPNGSVDLTTNNDTWQKWEWKQIDNNRYYWKSFHGSYLRGYPDGKVDLSPYMMDWEIWTKVDHGSYHLWRSFHGTYLRGHPDGRVDLAETAIDWEKWID